MVLFRIPRPLATCLALLSSVPVLGAAAPSSDKIDFVEETLENGLHVIYAPLHQAPVVHVRVIYHVGSRDERPDRQGFAHMFEHMMFRGSAHVAPEEHMKLVGIAGGMSNAFTSFDQTVYHDTIPAEHLAMTLYLEADRMASFKVSEQIYKTERKVVAEEWRMKQNRPYGNLYEDFLKNAFTSHSYRWTPIGNMDDLRAAKVEELQDFFNTYYLPNNATLVISGDIDVEKAKEMVHRDFAWIPPGPAVQREIPPEPAQTEARQATVLYRVPLPAVMIGYHVPPYRSEEHTALSLLGDVLGAGGSSRLHRLLVSSEHPLAVDVSAGEIRLEDAGMFTVHATVLPGRDAHEVEQQLKQAVAGVVDHGVTAEELEKCKTQERVALVRGRETATTLAEQLGEESVFSGDAGRVNTELARLDAVTPADIQTVAKKYLLPSQETALQVQPDPLGKGARAAATQAAMDAPVAPATRPVTPRQVAFPGDWPAHAPLIDVTGNAHFDKGTETEVNGVRVIVLSDSRLPLVSWSLTTRSGGHADPTGKEGLSAITDEMLQRGAGDLTYARLTEDLESRGITLEITDGGDFTRLSGSCITAQLEHALGRTRDILFSPTLPADEFAKVKEQTLGKLQLSQENPATVAQNDLMAALYRGSPLGRVATPQSVQAIGLEDVKTCYLRNLQQEGAILVFSGDVSVERARELAARLLAGWSSRETNATISYPRTAPGAKRHIILIDRPGGKQSTVRIGIPAYDIQTDEKYAGSLAGQILTAGIDSRLGRYVRAEKGLCYTVFGIFQPGRHGGAFIGGVDTAIETTADAVEAMLKVFNDMRKSDVSSDELAQARARTAGNMIMGMQTIQQQAGYRVDAVLNGYPVDYYDQYPMHIGAVTADQVRDVVSKYVNDTALTIVVVAPADSVKDQLERLGDVEVVPMPAKRSGATTQPVDQELVKPVR